MKPRLLDLFCGAGGAAKGYQRAGFHVVGVDIEPQPNYCGDEFVLGDALDVLDVLLSGGIVGDHGWQLCDFAAIHASPPCQFYSEGGAMPDARDRASHPDLIAPTRQLLCAAGLPYVIENVRRSPLRHPTLICGSALGLGADGHVLARHRLFETSFPMPLFFMPPCRCGGSPVIGIYGDRAKTSRGATLTARTRWNRPDSLVVGGEAMGIDWMTWRELREAIPPAYCELIGHQLMQHVTRPALSEAGREVGGR